MANFSLMPSIRLPEADRERGSAAVEFVLVGTLVVLIGLAVIQLVLALHVRNTLTSSAFEGAREGARADQSLAQGEQRSLDMAQAALGGINVEAHASSERIDGTDVVIMRLEAPVPLVGLWGPGVMTVEARAFDEAPDG